MAAGLEGAAGGYERGQENKELSAKTELVQMQAQQMKAQMANQKALTAMAPIWAKDIPEDQRPVFNALISSTDPKEQQQAFEMRTRELAKPASIAGIVALNPQLKAADLNSLPSSDLHDMFIKLFERNPTEFEQKVRAVQDANPGISKLDATKQALAMSPEAALPATLSKIAAQGRNQQIDIELRGAEGRTTAEAREDMKAPKTITTADGSIKQWNPDKKRWDDTGMKGDEKGDRYVKVKGAGGRDVYARASDAAKYGLDASGRETYYKVEDPSDPTKTIYEPASKVEGMAAPKTGSAASGVVLVPSGDGFYHKYDKATGKDEKTDVKIPPRGTTVDPELLKALTGADEIGGDEKPTAEATPEGAAPCQQSFPNREAAASASKDTPPSIPEFGGAGKLVGHDERGRGLYLFPDGKTRAWNKPKS